VHLLLGQYISTTRDISLYFCSISLRFWRYALH
jgi:hypothetical protein